MKSENKGRNRKTGRKRRKTKATKKKRDVYKGLPYGKTNYIILGTGLISIIIGFIVLNIGNTIISTILLVLGYMVLIPIALLLTSKGGKSEKKIGEPSVGSKGG